MIDFHINYSLMEDDGVQEEVDKIDKLKFQGSIKWFSHCIEDSGILEIENKIKSTWIKLKICTERIFIDLQLTK